MDWIDTTAKLAESNPLTICLVALVLSGIAIVGLVWDRFSLFKKKNSDVSSLLKIIEDQIRASSEQTETTTNFLGQVIPDIIKATQSDQRRDQDENV